MKLICIFLVVSVFACNSSDERTVESNQDRSEAVEEAVIDSLKLAKEIADETPDDSALLMSISMKIISEFKKETFSFKKIDSIISDKGLHFVPYGYHSPSNVHLPKDSINYYWRSNKTINWGSYDGSGDDINLTFKEYFDDFIWDMDFSQADTVMFENTKGLGNTIDNVHDYMPNAKFVEFYIEGKNPDYGGMDWGILRLIYEKDDNNEYKLIAISHGQWTV